MVATSPALRPSTFFPKTSWVNNARADIDGEIFINISSQSEIEISDNFSLSPEVYMDLKPYSILFNNEEDSTIDQVANDDSPLAVVLQNPFVSDLELKLLNQDNYLIEVFDSRGSRLAFQSVESQNEVRFDESIFRESGLFFLRISQGKRVETIKVIKI